MGATKPVGRPPIGDAVQVRLGTLLPEVDAWAAAQGISRAEAIRRLVESGLGLAALAGMQIHHRAGEPTNNDPGNLELRDTPTTEGIPS